MIENEIHVESGSLVSGVSVSISISENSELEVRDNALSGATGIDASGFSKDSITGNEIRAIGSGIRGSEESELSVSGNNII